MDDPKKMRISIVGYSGSGKSTFASSLSKIYGIEPTHLDAIYWLPGWIERPDHETAQLIAEVVAKDTWIIDGNYRRFSPDRHEKADYIFFFRFNRLRCLWNIIKRRFIYHKKTRPDMTEGNMERLDWAFFMWIMKDGRTKRIRQNYQNMMTQYKDKVIVFKNHHQVQQYLNKLKSK